MMRKTVSRLLALVLVLCLAVTLIPASAFAEEIVRPEGMTDEEWEAYLLKRKQMAEAVDEVVTGSDVSELPAEPAPTVSVEVPVDTPVSEEGKVVTEGTVENSDGTKETVSIEESYTVEATITEVEKSGDEVTDIEYDISMDKTTEIKDGNGNPVASAKDENGNTVTTKPVEDVDLANKEAAEAAKEPAPQYKVNMSVTGMKADPTRITHTKKPTTTPPDPADPVETEEPEYFYNAANGTEDTTKKYFTVTEVETEKTNSDGTLEKVKEKVVSLWTSFLGIFHITNDAFEGAADANGKKNTYDNLTEAAASEKKVEMLRDYETGATADLDKKVTVDLNGHDYTNTGDDAAMNVTGGDVTVKNGDIISNGAGAEVSGTGTRFSLKNIFLRSNANKDAAGNTAAVSIRDSGNTVDVDDTHIDGTRSTYGIQDTSTGKNTVNIDDSVIEGKTGVALKNTDADIRDSYLRSTSGPALSVDGNSKDNEVVITNGRFESGKAAANIYAKDKDDIASITVKGGRFTDPTGLCSYVPYGYAAICRNDGSYFLYEVVTTDYTPTREGYRFLGYTDGNGNAISLAEAYRKGVIAYAQWKEIPETAEKPAPLITVKTDEKNCTTKVTVKGDTAFVTVKDKDGDFAPISEVTIPSVKRLQNKEIDTVEIQVDEDVTLVLDIEKAKKNGFTDVVEVSLEKDILLITSGKDTCIELNVAELKASDKPVEIQLVEGELSVLLGKNSTMSVDLTKALKTGERIVVKLENAVLKLYDKYNKPIKE